MNCGIYKITNTVNGKVYIGSSIDLCGRFGRIKGHIRHLRGNYHTNFHLQRAWNKYGEDSFVFEVLLYCDKENLVFYEQRAIDEYKSLDNKFGYNICTAQRSNLTGSNYNKMCQKISESMIGNKHSKGIIRTEEFKKKISGKNNPNAKAVTINGKYYDTIKEAAQDLRITYYILRCRLKKRKEFVHKLIKIKEITCSE